MQKIGRKKISLAVMGLVLVLSVFLCGLTGGIFDSTETIFYTEPSKENSSISGNTDVTEPETKAIASDVFREGSQTLSIDRGSARVLDLSDKEESLLESFTSNNEDVVTVDDGGRIDALKNGAATVTANFSGGKSYSFIITVKDPEDDGIEYDGYSTAIIANQDVVAQNEENGDYYKNLYSIRVNRQENCVTVYTYDENGEYTIPVRAMVCSCGADNGTITGNFDIYFKNEWHPLYQDCYGHYVSGISGDYLFHSVPYYTSTPYDLEVEEFNKLGTSASLGCVRLAVADSKWIYDNCPYYTSVEIYDDDEAGPLGKPETITITDTSCGWDPTDDNELSPYYDKTPSITGVQDCTISVGDSFFPRGSVKAYDTCSNDITDSVKVVGNVITTKKGKYKVTYSVEDVLHRSTSVDIYVTVE